MRLSDLVRLRLSLDLRIGSEPPEPPEEGTRITRPEGHGGRHHVADPFGKVFGVAPLTGGAA